MNEYDKLLKLIDCLEIEELKLLKQVIDRKIHEVYQYMPSNDSEVLANYTKKFHYDPSRREEVLKKLGHI